MGSGNSGFNISRSPSIRSLGQGFRTTLAILGKQLIPLLLHQEITPKTLHNNGYTLSPGRSPLKFIDEYCQNSQDLFSQVRNYEAFKLLHLGLVSELPRKSLPKIARAVGLSNSQSLPHFLRDSTRSSQAFTQRRLQLIVQLIGQTEIILCSDETADEKKGQATDYVAKQYIGNLGKTETAIVSVNAYGIVATIT